MSARARTADFWDDVLASWSPGDRPTSGDVAEWFGSYRGRGRGELDLSVYPDPYVGDLRGETHTVRMVTLGLNPGTGYPTLQGPDGLWTSRIKASSYSRCFARSPAEDPDAWVDLHGKPSAYWRNLLRFAQRWTSDATLDVHGLLNLELYPWHSPSLTATLTPPADVVRRYVWDAVEEVEVDEVFAFGRPWIEVCQALDLDEVGRWGPEGDPLPAGSARGWRVVIHRLNSGQLVVVSSQPGYAGPPGPARLDVLRDLVAEAHRR